MNGLAGHWYASLSGVRSEIAQSSEYLPRSNPNHAVAISQSASGNAHAAANHRNCR